MNIFIFLCAHAFAAGDYVIFPKGLKCTWEIKKRIKKHYKFG
ncbi:MAG: cupin domain-containing protein [Candidatus Bathyarchaeota archaeon]|nr:cupin domain-containing protein [Candidatus Bathyarchaeota archaeon]